jgi:hypothetical protein
MELMYSKATEIYNIFINLPPWAITHLLQNPIVPALHAQRSVNEFSNKCAISQI